MDIVSVCFYAIFTCIGSLLQKPFDMCREVDFLLQPPDRPVKNSDCFSFPFFFNSPPDPLSNKLERGNTHAANKLSPLSLAREGIKG
jgi:hypothetical protein